MRTTRISGIVIILLMTLATMAGAQEYPTRLIRFIVPFPLMQSVPYDPIKDLAPITLVERTPMIVVVHPSLPVKSIQELVALAKKIPGQLNYASGISGATTHLFPELFKSMAGVDIVRVTYKGGAPAIIALLGGETQLCSPMPAAPDPMSAPAGLGRWR